LSAAVKSSGVTATKHLFDDAVKTTDITVKMVGAAPSGSEIPVERLLLAGLFELVGILPFITVFIVIILKWIQVISITG